MSLINKIRNAQILAGEDAVISALQEKGLMPKIIKQRMIEINEVLKILNENYEASKKIEDKKEREILIETYEDLIAIFNHKRNLAE